ncbi:MAG: amino acid permease [Proteobacteria bacterium]|nr:amino acid permease [Pseudomonadota bacterium]
MAEYRFSSTTGIAIVVANMIGTGVFVSLGYQLLDIQSPFVLLMLWLVGGVTALCGALTYAELGANLPRSGGEYHFLKELYHPSFGFISGWVSVTVGFAAPTALVAMTFAAYLRQAFPALPGSAMAIGLIVVLGLFHARSRRSSSLTQMTFTAVKVVLIGLFVMAVMAFGANPQPVSLVPKAGDLAMVVSGTFAVSLIYVNYAYTGWNAATYVMGEMRDGARRLPLVLLVGTTLVMLVYLLLNFSFLKAAPMAAMSGKLEIGVIAAQHAFGPEVAMTMAIVLSLLFISTVSAMTMAGPRVLQVIGEDFAVFRWLGVTNQSGVPARAVAFQSLLAIGFILTGSFESVLLFTGFILSLNTFLAIMGVFLLRYQGRLRPGAYRTWGYPVTPLLYLGLTLWTLIYIVINNPVEAFAGLAMIAIGMLAYLASGRFDRRQGHH